MPIPGSGNKSEGSHKHGVKENMTELKEDSGNS